MEVPTPRLEHSFSLKVDLGTAIELGSGRAGQRRIIPIIGGTALGPDIEGKVLNLGADWQTIFNDGAAHLDTRYAIETKGAVIIEVVNVGTRHGPTDVLAQLSAGEDVDPSKYYMRTAARLEAGDARYSWVNHTIFVCAGIRRASSVEIAYYKVV